MYRKIHTVSWAWLAALCLPALAWASAPPAQARIHALAKDPAQTRVQPAPAASAPAPAPIPFVSPHEADIRVASAPDAWGGPRTSADATLSDRVTSYTI